MQDIEFMKKAIELSKAAVEHGNEPFGAVLVLWLVNRHMIHHQVYLNHQ